jgi:tRNA1Val (adenine37-N6)-methyltransferase
MNEYFHFKKFSVSHKRSSMKVGTDGVLLGAWVNVKDSKTILDIGTGTGLIALMLAQRTPADTHIDAVEPDEPACLDAEENFKNAPWANRIFLHQASIQAFQTTKKYDLIISNPPYFINSYKPPDKSRHIARHADTLTFEELIHASLHLLEPEGRLAVILPQTEGQLFLSLTQRNGLFCIRQWTFRSRSHKPIERLLLEFGRHPEKPEMGELLLYDQGERWSEGYVALTKEFYLNI